MELTTFQKQIVGHIIEGKVIDIISFAQLKYNHQMKPLDN